VKTFSGGDLNLRMAQFTHTRDNVIQKIGDFINNLQQLLSRNPSHNIPTQLTDLLTFLLISSSLDANEANAVSAAWRKSIQS